MIADAAISELSVLVVDDEPLARARLVKMLRSLGVKSVEQFGDGDACLQHYQTSGAHVVLLDIEMPGTPGVAVAEKLAMLDPAPVVIFCTAYDNYALQAFDASATDYLLKPVAKDRLEKALQKAVAVRPDGTAESSPAISEGVPDHIWVSKALGRQRIELADIRYLYADAKYVTAVTESAEYLLEGSLKYWESTLEPVFIRVHRSTLVAIDAIIALEKTSDSQMTVRLRGISKPLSVSRRHSAGLNKRLILKS